MQTFKDAISEKTHHKRKDDDSTVNSEGIVCIMHLSLGNKNVNQVSLSKQILNA